MIPIAVGHFPGSLVGLENRRLVIDGDLAEGKQTRRQVVVNQVVVVDTACDTSRDESSWEVGHKMLTLIEHPHN